jgi:catechol 2,3-dioxygenase-like lactoylglutathione lyase family enzyme
MKHIIAKLLQDFETGFMNRRQLIESLALAATAASALAQTPGGSPAAGSAAKGHGSAFKTVELDHISFQVNDYRVTRDFYADLMGMDVKNDNGKTQCELYFGNSMLLARNHFRPQGGNGAPAGAPAAAAAPPAGAGGGRGQRPPTTALVDHLSYRIYSWDTDQVKDELMRRKLLTADARPDTGGGIPGYSSFHVSDPDGYNLQISGNTLPKDSVNKK